MSIKYYNNNQKAIISERVDDIPLILQQLSIMKVQPLIDEHFQSHGNWGGASLGWTIVVWLTFILSQSDHRMVYVENWVRNHQQTLAICTGQPIRPLDFCDDRLSRLLTYLSRNDAWSKFHSAFVSGQVYTFNLDKQVARHDATTVSSYGRIIENGLLQLGFSKDGKPGLGHIKPMLSSLDPLGLPVAVSVLSGEKADDPLYLPAIEQTRKTLGPGLLHVGDAKMAALETRARIVEMGDAYLCPLPKTMWEDMAVYLKPVQQGDIKMLPIERKNVAGKTETIAEGYERRVTHTFVLDTGTPAEKTVTWEETQWIIRSFAYAQAEQKSLQKRVDDAKAQIDGLLVRRQGKKQPQTRKEAEQMAENILAKHRVTGLIDIDCRETFTERTVRGYAGQPEKTVQDCHLTLTSVLNQQAFEDACRQLGCRVYASANAKMTMTEAILLYRKQDIIENDFARLKGQPFSLNPMFLQRDDHRVGLVRVLTLGLSALCLVEFVLRRRLQEANTKLPILANGKQTQRPTAERILKAFQHIDLVINFSDKKTECRLLNFTTLHKQILDYLGFPLIIYERLICNITNEI